MEAESIAPLAFSIRKDAPKEAQTVFMLKIFGLNNCDIGRRLGVSEGTVRYHLNTYDPEGECESSNMMRKLVLGSMLERVAFEALTSMKPEEIRKLGPKDKLVFVREAMKARQSLGDVDLPEKPNEKKIHDSLKGGSDDKDGAKDSEPGDGVGGRKPDAG